MSRLTRWLLGHAWLARAIVVVGILGTAASAYVSHTEVEFETHAIFEKFAGDIPGDIEASVRAYSDLLYSLRGLFNSSGHVSREDFHRFVAALELKERYPGLTNLSYAFRVQHADRQRFEQSVRGEVTPLTAGLPEFRIRPSAERPEYHVLTYIEPLAENAIAHGLDLGSDPQRLSIVENARDSGTVSTTVGLTLLRDSGTQHQSVLMRLAVYRTGHVPASVELRREQYVGLAGVALRLNELMSSLALKFPRLKDVRIVIRDYIEGEGLGPVLYDSLHPQHTTVPQVMPGRIWISQPIHAGDRQWHLSVTPLENPLSPEYAALPYLVALAGLCLTFLVYVSRTTQISSVV